MVEVEESFFEGFNVFDEFFFNFFKYDFRVYWFIEFWSVLYDINEVFFVEGVQNVINFCVWNFVFFCYVGCFVWFEFEESYVGKVFVFGEVEFLEFFNYFVFFYGLIFKDI